MELGDRVDLPGKFMLSDRVVARQDPVWFAQRFLGVRPWGKQRDVLRALRDHDFVAVRSCNGSGKTFTAALATLWWLSVHDEATVITTASSERQVKEMLWREIRHLHGKNAAAIGGKVTSMRLEISDKRFAYGFSTDTAGRFQGFHSENILVIVDEASEVREYIFDAIFGCLTSENAKMLMIGNPSNLAGTFYDAFHTHRDRWKTIHISAFDTPAFRDVVGESEGHPPLASLAPPYASRRGLNGNDTSPPGMATPKWAEMIAAQRGENSSEYQFRVLGEFPSEADDTLISLRLIEAAVERELVDVEDRELVMGVDVARYGDNQTVAIVRRGPEVLEINAFGRSDLMRTTGRVMDVARRHKVKKLHVDEVGVGAGVVDRAKELDGVTAIGVNGGNRARDPEKYLNVRAEMFEGLRQRFADGDIRIPDDSELISQLASLRFSYTSRGQLQLEGKDQIRKSGRQSPDKADALALAFATPWVPAEPMIWFAPRERQEALLKVYRSQEWRRRRGLKVWY